jgi:iron complex transport system substrate-binding protein
MNTQNTYDQIHNQEYYPSRIVCLTEETTETLYLLGAKDLIVGISGFTVRPAQARKEKPRVSTFTDADIDQIIALRPDLVIGYSDIQANIAQQLISRGITVWVNTHHSISGILKMIVQLGAIIGKTKVAIALVERLQRGLDAVAPEASQLSTRPRVYFEEWYDPLICGSLWVSELISIAGGVDILQQKAQSRLATGRIIADPDDIVQADPEIILASWCGKMFKPERLTARKDWNRISAVAQSHVYEIKSPLILQPGPAALTDGLKEIQKAIQRWKKDQPN